MHFGRVIGTVVCTEKVPSLKGQRTLLVQPTDSAGKEYGNPFVAVDTTSAGPGQWVFYIRSREAAAALPNPDNPADAAIMGIVDTVREWPLEGGSAGPGSSAR